MQRAQSLTFGQDSAVCRKEVVMPLVRIDLVKGRSDAERKAIAQAVYDAMHAIGVPLDDQFEVITEHDPANFVYPRSYLGISHTGDLVIVQITFNEGRTTEQKKTLFKGIAEGIREAIGIGLGDVFISLVEVKKENWSFGNGIAQYAEAKS
jgi:phenylpyruvate tautomerase PptA (4-oxalocrotonate tautomerase family)